MCSRNENAFESRPPSGDKTVAVDTAQATNNTVKQTAVDRIELTSNGVLFRLHSGHRARVCGFGVVIAAACLRVKVCVVLALRGIVCF